MIRESRQYLWFRLTVLGTGVALLSALVIASVQLWPIAYRTLVPTRLSCGCAILSMTTSWWLIAVATTVISLTLMVVSRATWLFIGHLRRSHRLEQHQQEKLVSRIRHLALGIDVTMVDDPQPLAMTVGLLHPTIYVSRGLLRRLSSPEFRAVVAHERVHQRAYDPLLTVLMETVTGTFRWLPGVGEWMAAGYSLRELAADAVATDGYRQTAALSSAFLKLSTTTVHPTISAFSPNRDRLEKLLDHHWTSPRRWWNWATVLVVVGITWGALTLGHLAVAKNPIVPMAAACHETIIMCRAEHGSLLPGRWCPNGQCLSRTQYWSPLYASTPAQ